MNRTIVVNSVRFVILILLQVLVLRRITFDWSSFGFIHVLLYPLAILALPIRTPKWLVLILGVVTGLIVDMFYDSPGVHASALVFTAYMRTIVIKLLEPFGGYNVEDSPTLRTMGSGWYMTYAAVMMFIHIFFYFSVEAFSFVFIFEIMMNTIFSFVVSILIIFILQITFRPKY